MDPNPEAVRNRRPRAAAELRANDRRGPLRTSRGRRPNERTSVTFDTHSLHWLASDGDGGCVVALLAACGGLRERGNAANARQRYCLLALALVPWC